MTCGLVLLGCTYYSQSAAAFYMCCLHNKYIPIAKTYILGTESLDFIVSIWHKVSQGDSKVTNGHGVIYIVRPVLFTLALIRK